MPIALTAVPRGFARIDLEDIPQDVKDAIEEAYTHCQKNDGERIQAAFPDQDAADEFLSQARSYAYQREAGRLTVTGNSTKKGYARFRVETYVKPAEEAPEGEKADASQK